jgi:hypothetical protein
MLAPTEFQYVNIMASTLICGWVIMTEKPDPSGHLLYTLTDQYSLGGGLGGSGSGSGSGDGVGSLVDSDVSAAEIWVSQAAVASSVVVENSVVVSVDVVVDQSVSVVVSVIV